ncbi:hypothetical protein DV515_00010673 [Chloebia gouldiae]|uniref:Uncharacterized protein n=1 Tax=Chloebia gouldiae TaxID=44316 RepID=A0A3L8S8N3_CHLGU|nr:hypothetical protein DV515_00010673 [Chloebia gouldiae]
MVLSHMALAPERAITGHLATTKPSFPLGAFIHLSLCDEACERSPRQLSSAKRPINQVPCQYSGMAYDAGCQHTKLEKLDRERAIVCKKIIFPTRGNTEKEEDSARRITIKTQGLNNTSLLRRDARNFNISYQQTDNLLNPLAKILLKNLFLCIGKDCSWWRQSS